QLKYMNLFQELNGSTLKRLLILEDYLAQAANRPPASPLWLPPVQLLNAFPLPLKGPFDDLDAEGVPFISQVAISISRSRLNIADPTRMFGNLVTPASGTPSR